MHLATQRYATHVERLRILFEHFHVGIVGGNGGFLNFFLEIDLIFLFGKRTKLIFLV